MTDTPPVWYEVRNAVAARDYEAAERLVIEQPSLVHLCNSLGETVLHFLAVENDAEGVAWLHARGAALDTKNKFGAPVVFEVAQLEYKGLFTWFLVHGADAEAVDAEGQDIIDYLLEYEHDEMATWVRAELESRSRG